MHSGTKPLTSTQRGRYKMLGRIITVIGTDPAAGVEVADNVPAGEIWELISVRFVLVTDATVANREVRLFISDGSNNIFRSGTGVLQVASLTINYFAAAFGFRGALDNAGLELAIPIPPGLILLPAYVLGTATFNLQAGDDFSFPLYNVRQH